MHGNSLEIEVMGRIRYPDAFVTCTPARRGGTVPREPVVIFAVLSRGTARTDRMVKHREYASTASVRRYIMLEQTAVEATEFRRTDDADWVGHIIAPDAVPRMPETRIELPLAEIYADIDLSAPDPDEADDT